MFGYYNKKSKTENVYSLLYIYNNNISTTYLNFNKNFKLDIVFKTIL